MRWNEDYAKISLRKLKNTASDDQTDWKISYISAKREVIALKRRQQNPSNYKAVSIHPHSPPKLLDFLKSRNIRFIITKHKNSDRIIRKEE